MASLSFFEKQIHRHLAFTEVFPRFSFYLLVIRELHCWWSTDTNYFLSAAALSPHKKRSLNCFLPWQFPSLFSGLISPVIPWLQITELPCFKRKWSYSFCQWAGLPFVTILSSYGTFQAKSVTFFPVLFFVGFCFVVCLEFFCGIFFFFLWCGGFWCVGVGCFFF